VIDSEFYFGQAPKGRHIITMGVSPLLQINSHRQPWRGDIARHFALSDLSQWMTELVEQSRICAKFSPIWRDWGRGTAWKNKCSRIS